MATTLLVIYTTSVESSKLIYLLIYFRVEGAIFYTNF